MAEDDVAAATTTGVAYEPLLEQSAEDLYENAPCGYFSTLPDGTIVRVNGTFLAWTGYAREELVGKRRFHELLPPGDRIYYETHYAPLLQMQGMVREIAVEVVCAGGERLPVLVNSVLKSGSDGTPRLVRTSVFDARDRRRYERELLRARRQAEERARAALALAHVDQGVLLLDGDDRVLLLNPAAETILAVSGETIVGQALGSAVPAWAPIAELIPVGAPDRWPPHATLPLARGDGEAWIAVAGVDSGDGIVYTIRDVTSERRLEELRNDLVTVVSHELRTPLASIYGAAQTLLDQADTLPDPLRRQLLEVIVEQGERQQQVLDEILLTSRLDTGSIELRDDVVDALALVAEATDSLGAGSASKARLVVDAGPAEPVRVQGDPASAAQVLACLVDNALKYSPPEAPVRVSVQALDRWGRITIADAGPGIPPGEQELVFEKFYRLDPGQRTGVAGIGLGLYIARELVLRMQGRIGLLPADRGAAFYLDLPLAD